MVRFLKFDTLSSILKFQTGYHPLRELKPQVEKLAKQRSGFVGLKAVAAFEALCDTSEY